MIGPGHPAYRMPSRPDDQIRRAKDIERNQRENSAARSLESSTISSGQLTVASGGSIAVDGGTLDLSGSDINVSGNIVAGGDIEGDTLTTISDSSIGGGLDVTGDTTVDTLTASGNVLISGALRVPDVYTHLVASSPRAVYVNSTDGRIGNLVSSRRFKQDIVPADIDESAIEKAEVVNFRYIKDVEDRGDAAEPFLGGIAEQFDDAGLGYLVQRDWDGKPLAIDERALIYSLLGVIQKHAGRIRELENKIDNLDLG